MNPLWDALSISLQIAIAATAVAVAVAVPIAFVMARRNFVGKSVVEAIILLPLVLPPTVIGYLLITLLGSRGLISQFFGDYTIVFRFEGAVLAAAIVALLSDFDAVTSRAVPPRSATPPIRRSIALDGEK